MVEVFGGSLHKKSMNTIPFNAEMRTLAYVMIHNLYPVTNLTTLFGPRTIFPYNLYTHKEIDICGHIFHLLTKSITKRNTRTIMPFPALIMGLIAKTRLKISVVSPLCQEIIPLVLTLWLKAELTSPDPKTRSLKYQGIMLRKRVEIPKKRSTDSPQHQKFLLNHPLKHKHEDLIVWIVLWHR